jgi:hypothetical protein
MNSIDIQSSANILKVIRSKNSVSQLYKRISSGYEFTDSAIKYNIAYHGAHYQDISICVYLNEQPALFLPLYLHQNKASYFGASTQIFESDLTSEQKVKIYKKLLSFLKKKIEKFKINEIKIIHNEFLLNAFHQQCDEIKSIISMQLPIDIQQNLIKSTLRKSYKSLVNWGKDNLTPRYIDKNNYCEIKAQEFRKFHIRVAGKETRSRATWEVQFDMLKAGEAFLHLYYLKGELVAGSFILLGENTAFYGVGVYDRHLMESKKLPLSHWPLLNAIYTCQKLGLTSFDFGFYDDNDIKSQQISAFKKGFSVQMNIINTLRFTFIHE